MLKLLLVLGLVILGIGIPVARAARRFCRRLPRRRPWVVAGTGALLLAVALATPHLDNVIPNSMRESPAGLIPVLGAAVALCLVALFAGSVLAGALLSYRSSSGEPVA